MRTIQPTCPNCRGDAFEVRFKKDEGVATAKCMHCANDYLLLDSGDYWFDVIQPGYPRVSKCACQGTAFQLSFDYAYREEGDVKSIKVSSTCVSCRKTKRQMTVDIDYSPTQHLIDQPLTFCKNPKILYKLKELNLYVTAEDMARIADYLGRVTNCSFYGMILRENVWIQQAVDLEVVKEAILKVALFRASYIHIYALPTVLSVPAAEVDTIPKETIFWKRSEVIRISSPTHVDMGSTVGSQVGLLFYLRFANEYVKDETIVPKTQRFREVTTQMVTWLKEQFVSWRGQDCFDNPDENVRLFGERFRSKAKR